MTIELREFRLRLERYVPHDSPLRPFVCDGSPLERANGIFIVGINPAKKLGKNFWDYWDISYGFNKEAHLHDLKQLPRGLGPARRKIERIADEIGQHTVLDTNIFAFPAQSPKEIPHEYKVTKVFEFLLRELRPQLVLAHGKAEAVSVFRDRCGKHFVEDYETPRDVSWDGLKFKLLCSNHLRLPAVDSAKIAGILKRAYQTPQV